MRCVAAPAIQQHPLQDAEIVCGEVSRAMLHELGTLCPPTIISKSGLNVCFWHKADIAATQPNVCFQGNSGHWGMSALPQKRTLELGREMSALCQKRTLIAFTRSPHWHVLTW